MSLKKKKGCNIFRFGKTSPKIPPIKEIEPPIDEPQDGVDLPDEGTDHIEPPAPRPAVGMIGLDYGHTSHRTQNKSPEFGDGFVLYEFKTVRDIGDFIEPLLTDNGFLYELTAPPVDGPENFAHRKRVADEMHFGTHLPNLFTSLHTNAVGDGSGWRNDAGGIEVFYYTGNERTRAAAKVYARHVHEATGFPLRGRDEGARPTRKFFVLRELAADGVLIEFCFHTNKDEATFLRDPRNLEKLAVAYINATIEIFSTIFNPASVAFVPAQIKLPS